MFQLPQTGPRRSLHWCVKCRDRGRCNRPSLVSTLCSNQRLDPTLFRSAATSTIRELQDRNSQLDRHIGQLQQALLDALKGDKGIYEPSHPLHEGMLHEPVVAGIDPGSSELMKLKRANNIASSCPKVLIYMSWLFVAAAHRKPWIDWVRIE